MLVATVAVGMAVLKLLCGSIADVDNVNLEIQVNPGKRVVTVDGNHIAFHFNNRNHNHIAVGALGMEWRPRGYVYIVWECFFGYVLHPNHYVLALLVLAASLVLAKLVDLVVVPVIRRWSRLTETTFDDELLAILRRPMFMSIILIGLGVTADTLELYEQV